MTVGCVGSARRAIMDKTYHTTSRFGYCLIDQKPPRLGSDALYRIVGKSMHYDGRPIIERCDGKKFEGETRWIVDPWTLTPA